MPTIEVSFTASRKGVVKISVKVVWGGGHFLWALNSKPGEGQIKKNKKKTQRIFKCVLASKSLKGH